VALLLLMPALVLLVINLHYRMRAGHIDAHGA
jgi:hypothetical protein